MRERERERSEGGKKSVLKILTPEALARGFFVPLRLKARKREREMGNEVEKEEEEVERGTAAGQTTCRSARAK